MPFTNQNRTTRRPPPNYLSRSVQRRLFLAVGSLMLVVILMSEARKPQNWQWMWAEQSRGAAQIDTRLPDVDGPIDPPGTVYANFQQAEIPTLDKPQLAAEDAVNEFRSLGWDFCLAQLSRDDRWALDRILKESRRPTATAQGGQRWRQAITRLADVWNDYFKQANQEVLLSPVDQQRVWLQALVTLEIEWARELEPALGSVVDARALTEPQRKQLADLQNVIDRLSLGEVQDNTVWRAAEQHAWFRLLEQLRESELQQLRHTSTGRASFVQLFRQPAEYRGKLVTVDGRAKLGYRVAAPRNIHGIEHYYIFWLQPSGGQNSPFVVYSLDLPQGFPAVQDKDRDGAATTLDEDVMFDAYFFKRWAYRAQDGVNTAPLLLAKAPIWQPRANRTASRTMPSLLITTLSIVGVLGISIGLAYLAYVASNRPRNTALDKHKMSGRRASFGDQKRIQGDLVDDET